MMTIHFRSSILHVILLALYITCADGLPSRDSKCRCIEKPPSQLIVDCSSQGLYKAPEYLPRNLTTLDLSNNSISFIPKHYFGNFTELTHLNISDNPVLGLKNASISFYGLNKSKVKVINASGVVSSTIGCVTLKKDFFIHLQNTSLGKIYLDRNRILTIEPSTLNSVPTSMFLLSLRKTRLVISGNICKQFLALSNLTTLDISHLNREAYLPDIMNEYTFTEATQRRRRSHAGKETSIKSWRLMVVPVPPNLENLFAKDCNFKMDVREGTEIRFSRNNLRVLNLSKNRFGKFMGKLGGLKKLEVFDFSENSCDHITPKLSQYIPNLRTLNLQGNNLRFHNNKFIYEPFKYLENLDISYNKIHRLSQNVFEGFPALRKLTLRGNIIYNFNVKVKHMTSLNHLDLSYNQINYLSNYATAQLDAISRKTSRLSLNLTANPLTCSCKTLFFIEWIESTNVIIDKQNLYCFLDDGRKKYGLVIRRAEELKHQCTSHVGIAMGGLVAVTGSIVIIVMGLVFRFRWKLRYLYYIVRDKYRSSLVTQQREEIDYDFDAFISYAEEDAEFAVNTFQDKLEGQNRLCFHQRDFRPGESIAGNILSAIQKSRHVVIVLSPNFLDSYWCRWEFEMARMEGLYTERNVVILVRYHEVLPGVVPRDMLYMMHTQTYLEYPEGQQDQDTFWAALKQAIDDD